jgi:hypothetical protein
MIIFSQFGFALRHKIDFNPKTKKGSLLLWSYYDGSFVPQDVITNANNSSGEALVLLLRKGIAEYYAVLPIGGIKDLLSILAAIVSIRQGKEYSFSNYEDRAISFQHAKNDKEQGGVTVKIRYSANTGKLIESEIIELETMIRDILTNLGLKNQEITERLKNLLDQSSSQTT